MLVCMRTTLNIDDQLAAAAKAEAQRSGTTVTSLVEEGLRKVLAERVPDEGDLQRRIDRILAHGRAIAAELPDEWRYGDPADHLYDDRGLPA
jgi:hypothetical protein